MRYDKHVWVVLLADHDQARANDDLLTHRIALARRVTHPDRILVAVHGGWPWPIRNVSPENVVLSPGDRGTAPAALASFLLAWSCDPEAVVALLTGSSPVAWTRRRPRLDAAMARASRERTTVFVLADASEPWIAATPGALLLCYEQIWPGTSGRVAAAPALPSRSPARWLILQRMLPTASLSDVLAVRPRGMEVLAAPQPDGPDVTPRLHAGHRGLTVAF
ncbi:MAG: hypothetical protein U0166_28870 [Acidobacteriota bacterium]